MLNPVNNPGDALLNDILLNPDDIDLRRIYSDWLEDNGQVDRANFIRSMFTVGEATLIHHSVPTMPGKKTWSDPIDKLCDYGDAYTCWCWQNGFVYRVECMLEAWLKHGKELVLAHPITQLHIMDRSPSMLVSYRSVYLPPNDSGDHGTPPLYEWRGSGDTWNIVPARNHIPWGLFASMVEYFNKWPYRNSNQMLNSLENKPFAIASPEYFAMKRLVSHAAFMDAREEVGLPVWDYIKPELPEEESDD